MHSVCIFVFSFRRDNYKPYIITNHTTVSRPLIDTLYYSQLDAVRNFCYFINIQRNE